jgi:hypothetical protein
MPAGLPYFAWVDASETTFGPEHMRWDESIFSFTLKQDEGDPASLTAVVRRPQNTAGDPIGLLGPGRKIWAWFALDCGPALMKFRGRLVGIPTSIFEELVTLEFVARPVDVVAQKEALADTLRVLPYYDEVVIDKARRSDPDVVLEGYTKIWHYDRETYVVTVSDEITGEDGLVEFDGASEDGKVLYDGLGLTLTSGPLSRVDVAAEYTWTQQGFGTVDLTNYLVSNWPGAINGEIQSYTMSAGDWPKTGAAIGDGWVAAFGEAHDLVDLTVKSKETGYGSIVKNTDGSGVQTTISKTDSYLALSTGHQTSLIPAGAALNPDIHWSYTMSTDGDGLLYTSSSSYSSSWTESYFAMQAFQPKLVAGWIAHRQCTERVSFSLFADVQPILTDPEDGEALRIDDVRSVNLSDPEEGTPIGDPRRRSYIATERGNQSLEHLIALARANLMMRARVVEIAFAPKLARMAEITLRKNAFLAEPRVGEALGKIIAYSLALDGSDGRINCEVRIGCTIGRGGTVAAADGTPTYCTIDYAGADYQQFINRTVLFPLDTSVGYSPPAADPNDDGLDLLSALRVEDVIDTPLAVVFGPLEQHDKLKADVAPWGQIGGVQADPAGNTTDALAAQNEAFKNMLKQYETRATFKLKSMTREFSSDYEIEVTDLMVPTGYDLEAV